jgi:hypothetical protein
VDFVLKWISLENSGTERHSLDMIISYIPSDGQYLGHSGSCQSVHIEIFLIMGPRRDLIP